MRARTLSVFNRSHITRTDIASGSFWKKLKSVYIAHLDIELTERCNNDCVHCYINLPANDIAAKRKELSSGELKKIIKEAAALDCMSLRFTGGEPLLRDDFEELYVFTRRLGLEVTLFTNATLITSRLARLFKRIPPRRKVEVTAYGAKRFSYESVTRNPGSFGAFSRGINLLIENNVPFIMKGALLPGNRSEIRKIERWAKSIEWMDGVPFHYVMFFDLRCRRDDMEKNRFIRSIRPLPEEGLKMSGRDRIKYINGMKEFCSKFMGPPGAKLFSCGAGCNGSIDAYGGFQPCMMLRHPDTVYDLKNGSLKDALTNFFPGVRRMKAANQEYLDRCARCFLKGLCEQCPAKSWMEHGTLDTPVEYLCDIAHAQARYLGLVKNNENAWEVKGWKSRVKNFSEKYNRQVRHK